jgi:hypothetical protein
MSGLDSVSDVVKLLGLSTPLLYAGAVYGMFRYLDKRASDEAKKTLASLFTPMPYDPKVVAAAILDVFDRLYAQPLFRPKAFVRSALLTLTLTTALAYEIINNVRYFDKIQFTDLTYYQYATPQLISNIFTDYLSLFLIRRWLLMAGRRPITALMGSFLVGTAIVLLAASVMRWTENVVVHGHDGISALQDNIFWWQAAVRNPLGMPDTPLLLPAIAVNMWLVLFAIGLVCLKLISPIISLTGKLQWFLDRGEQHALEAIGIVGAFFVLVGTAAIQVIGKVL